MAREWRLTGLDAHHNYTNDSPDVVQYSTGGVLEILSHKQSVFSAQRLSGAWEDFRAAGECSVW